MTTAEPRMFSIDLPLEERIRQRAHELYLDRDNGSRSEFDDWLEAERQVIMAVEQERAPKSMRVRQGRSAK